MLAAPLFLGKEVFVIMELATQILALLATALALMKAIVELLRVARDTRHGKRRDRK